MKFRVTTASQMLLVLLVCCGAQMPLFSQESSAAASQKTNQKADKSADSAQSMRRLPDGHPDFNGFWASSSGPDTPVGATFGPRDPSVSERDNAKQRLADPNQPPYKPELMDKIKELAKNESKEDPAFYCKPGGVPRVGPPHAILQAPGMPIIFLYQVVAGNTFRIIPTDGRPHNTNAFPSYYGDSIGHWEGDTLVVDTNDFNDDTWLGLDGWFHSDAMHVVEKLTRDGDVIHYQATVEDPNVFTRPWTMNPRQARLTTELIMENPPCIELDESHIVDPGVKTRPAP
jgi:hypothetical protein